MYHTRTPKSHFLPGRCSRRDRSVTGDVRNIHLTSCKKTVKLIFFLVFPPPGGSRPSREVARWFSDDTLLLPTDSNTDGITCDHLSSDLRLPAYTPAVVCFTKPLNYCINRLKIYVFFSHVLSKKSDVFVWFQNYCVPPPVVGRHLALMTDLMRKKRIFSAWALVRKAIRNRRACLENEISKMTS